jgi:hypothetical protein
MAAPLHTKYSLSQSSPRVTITRRHHPLAGKDLEVLCGGNSYLVVRLADKSSMRLPRAWTDADGPLAEHGHMPATRLTVTSLRELMILVTALKERS